MVDNRFANLTNVRHTDQVGLVAATFANVANDIFLGGRSCEDPTIVHGGPLVHPAVKGEKGNVGHSAFSVVV